jgi:RNA polymerase sigma-70 factor (ECF subfamily)
MDQRMTGGEPELLTRIAAGDEKALTDFYRQFEPRVYRFALSRLRNSFEAAEVLNEVMLQVWRSAARFEGRSKVSTWVLGITHHKVVDHLRKLGRVKTEEIDPAIPDEYQASAFRALAAAEDLQHLQFCMERLSDPLRQVIHLAFLESLPYTEIGEILACPEGTVKTRMFHARKQIKRCLLEHFGGTNFGGD